MKRVSNNFYVHKSNLLELENHLSLNENQILSDALILVNVLSFEFEIIKFNRNNNSCSFIKSHDWNIANEPTVGDSLNIKKDGSYKMIKGGSKVYHNKWAFVSSDYTGFNIDEAKKRTTLWNSIPNIANMKNQIGSKRIWHMILKENNIPI